MDAPLTIFIEPICHQFEVPPRGEAWVFLEDGHSHSIDIHPENWVSIWNDGIELAAVEVFAEHQFSTPER
ncbi:hypothetical protein [uncultured Sphingomonas sp.]|uniref:hypothetical protein n=1 Tax=uncultured Sphingomonas sp. TaxID=158754 RepID=UPI0025F27103|nr:hypothetical protein [uncultured Sphingomonas sp.]